MSGDTYMVKTVNEDSEGNEVEWALWIIKENRQYGKMTYMSKRSAQAAVNLFNAALRD